MTLSNGMRQDWVAMLEEEELQRSQGLHFVGMDGTSAVTEALNELHRFLAVVGCSEGNTRNTVIAAIDAACGASTPYIDRLAESLTDAVKQKREIECKESELRPFSDLLTLNDIGYEFRRIACPIDEVNVVKRGNDDVIRKRYAYLFEKRIRLYNEQMTGSTSFSVLSNVRKNIPDQAANKGPNRLQPTDFRYDSWQLIRLDGVDRLRYRVSAALVRSYRNAAEACLKEMSRLPNSKSHFFQLATRMLNRAKDALLREAYWDYTFADKASILQRQYDSLYRVCTKLEAQASQSPKAGGSQGVGQIMSPATSESMQIAPPFTNFLDTRGVTANAQGTLVAGRAFKARQVVFVEKILALQRKMQSYCSNCFRMIENVKWFPCRQCTSAVFCSAVCRDIAVPPTSDTPNATSSTVTCGEANGPHARLCGIADLVRPYDHHICFSFVAQIVISVPQLKPFLCVVSGDANGPTTFRDLYRLILSGSVGDIDERTFQVACAFSNASSVCCPTEARLDGINSLHGQWQALNRLLLAYSIALARLIALIRTDIKWQSDCVALCRLIYSWSWHIYHHPQATTVAAYKYPSAAAATAARQNTWKNKDDARAAVLGPFGVRLPSICDNNMFTRVRRNAGTIEYVARRDIAVGEPLSLGWNLTSGLGGDGPASQRMIGAEFKRRSGRSCCCVNCASTTSSAVQHQ